ncbi:hypothetical protein DAPPUDRAFT_259739 [Daphnia pulex]|uniref:Uncharacterized protein n=1 Tax=Daphnia pulex TaxID=6669 RepID=E9HHS4_DAPPU|nr:hypothetical protein DAPPUDRAFT_259739 [Daphnia pulex]|eukprot:EFX68682.1 hypothetical protein DAPPUDRAFT_259739 [Daphnia pulex]
MAEAEEEEEEEEKQNTIAPRSKACEREPSRRDADKQRFCAQTSEPKDHYTSTPALSHTQKIMPRQQQQQKYCIPDGQGQQWYVKMRSQTKLKKKMSSGNRKRKIKNCRWIHQMPQLREIPNAGRCHGCFNGPPPSTESAGPPRVPLDLRFHVRCDSSILQSAASFDQNRHNVHRRCYRGCAGLKGGDDQRAESVRWGITAAREEESDNQHR